MTETTRGQMELGGGEYGIYCIQFFFLTRLPVGLFLRITDSKYLLTFASPLYSILQGIEWHPLVSLTSENWETSK